MLFRSCIYDLIRKITLKIGGADFLSFSSNCLRMYDITQRKFEAIKNCCEIYENQIFYPIDLDDFFEIVNKSKNKGIQTGELFYHDIRLHIEFGEINDIIDVDTEITDEQKYTLSKLDVIEAKMYYRIVCEKSCVFFNEIVPQKISSWDFYSFKNFSDCSFKIAETLSDDVKTLISSTKGPLRLIIYSEKTINFIISVNGIPIDKIKITKYENIFELFSDIILSDKDIITLSTSDIDVEVRLMVNKYTFCLYGSGMVGIR